MKKVVEIKVNGNDWKEAQDKAFEKLNKKAKIDGFRPGKAPRSVFVKKYGEGEILREAMNDMVDKKYMEELIKQNIMPLLQPTLDIVKLDENELEAKITCIVSPEVKLGEYKKLNVKREKAKVKKEEIEHEMHHILEHYAEIMPKDGKVENGDIAIIDFEGFKDGVAFEGGKGENYSLEIGSHSFIPGFEEDIIGMSKGETKDLKLTFPEDYMAEDLKGKEVVFKVTVNDIKRRVVPELDEEFFKDLNMEGVTNKEELEKMLEEELLADKERQLEDKFIEALLSAALKNTKIEIDEELIDDEAEHAYHHFLEKMAMQGITEELYLKYANVTKEDILKDMRKDSERRIQYRYLLEEIIKQENIKVTDEEVNNEIKKMADAYGAKEEDVLKEVGGKEAMRFQLTMNKAIDCLKENN